MFEKVVSPVSDPTPARDVQWPDEAVEAVGRTLAWGIGTTEPLAFAGDPWVLAGGMESHWATQARAVLAALSGHVVPIAEHEPVVTREQRLRQAIRDEADLLDNERFPGGLRRPDSMIEATRLRALLGGEDQ